MTRTSLTAAAFVASLLTSLPTQTIAHSWNDQLALIGPDGSFVGPYGYPRAYVARDDPKYDGHSDMYLVPSLESKRLHLDKTDMLCHPKQRTPNQTPKHPRLKAAPGSAIAMKYMENGHVTLPSAAPGKAPKGGQVYVFGTTQPKPDEKIMDVLQWTKDGSGGNKAGRMLGAMDFDDGRCYQINPAAPESVKRQKEFPDPIPGQAGTNHEQWCESDIILPTDKGFVQPGKSLTLYWVWDFQSLPGTANYPKGKDEYYVTCSDIDIVEKAPSGPISNQLAEQDPQKKAAPTYKKRTTDKQVPRYAKGSSGGDEPNGGAPPQNHKEDKPAPRASAQPVSSQAPAPAPAKPAASAGMSPLPLSAYNSASASAPAQSAPPAASPAAPPTSPAAPVNGAMKTITATIPEGSPVFMVDGGKVVPLNANKKRDVQDQEQTVDVADGDGGAQPPLSSYEMDIEDDEPLADDEMETEQPRRPRLSAKFRF